MFNRILILFMINSLFVNAQQRWSLTDCIAYGRKHSQLAVEARIWNKSFREQQKQTLQQFLPSVSGFFNLSFQHNATDAYSHQAGIQLSQDLGLLYRRRHQAERIKNTISQADENISFAQNTIEEGTLRVYINALTLKRRAEVFNHYYRRNLRLGEKTGKETHYFMTALQAEDRLNLQAARRNADLALLQLKQLINLDMEQSFEIVDIPVYINAYEGQEEVYRASIPIDPTINQAKYAVLIAEKNKILSEIDLWPTVSLLYQNTLGWDPGNGGIYQNFFGIGVNIPVFNGRTGRTQLNIAKITLELRQKQLEHLLRNLEDAVTLIIRSLHNARETHKEARDALEKQKLEFLIMEQQFINGRLSNADYLSARNWMINAEFRAIDARYNYVLTAKLLDFFVGETL
ncbi:TolC family protein [Leptobacterium flavescens]|uniref:TolC family protein n=1 Tax=Leptobacterium flavescens TaxID=472055 RepID=A0A6P0UMM5_9FLAO|nr:TolC family protein [Leptobacterium flavescens]NER13710.1 TolC family protein [Leptobacterium flavescens]